MSPASALRLAQFEPQGRRGRRRLCPDALSGCGADGEGRTPFLAQSFPTAAILRSSRLRGLATSSARRARIQLGRSATGADKSGSANRSAACALSGSGPGATRTLRASTPPLMKSLRHSRTVSWRTLKASAIRPLVQPASVNKIARAQSASARPAAGQSLERRLPIVPRLHPDLPAMLPPPNRPRERNHDPQPLASPIRPAWIRG